MNHRHLKKVFVVIYGLLFSIPVFSQNEPAFLMSFHQVAASKVLEEVSEIYNVKISYADKYLKGKTISLDEKKRTLKEVLSELSELLMVDFKFINERFISVKPYKKTLDVVQQLNEVVLNSYLTDGISKNKDASFSVKPKELGVLAGLIEADVLESLQELPGIISPNETATGLNVRGGAVDQNQIIWDGITIYHSGHLFGMISPFNPYVTQNVTFYNKGTHPKFGESVSSVIDIATTAKIPEKTQFAFGFNGVNVDFNVNIPLVKEKLSVMLAFRRSFEDFLETPTFHNLEKKVYQNTSIVESENNDGFFYFKDFNMKWNYQLNKNNLFAFSLINIDNDLDYTFKNNPQKIAFQDVLDTENVGYSLSWDKKWQNNYKQHTQISASNYQLNYNYIETENNKQTSDFKKDNNIFNVNFSTEIAALTPKNNKISVGFQSDFKKVGYSFVETTDVQYVLDANDDKVHSFSLFGNYANRSINWFQYDLGFRTTYYRQLDAFRMEPRILIAKNIHQNLKIQATGEVKNQIISQVEETVFSDLSLETKIWKLANGSRSPIIHSKQMSIGLLYQNKSWSIDFDVYKKNISGMTALSLGFLDPVENDFHIGEQKILGSELYLKKDFNSLKTWISYSFTEVKNKYNGINSNNFFTASNEIKQYFTTSISYKIKKIQMAMAWKWHTGKPYTIANVDSKSGEITFDEINTGRLPNYHRLDGSVVYHFLFSKTSETKGTLGFSIRNMYNQKNLISKEYSGNNIPNDPIVVEDMYSVGFIPNFLFRIAF